MFVKNVHVENFKSFAKLSIDLDDFNVVIGANASGKSNFVNIFKFLRDIADYGLESAISMQGGVEYIKNCQISSDKELKISFTLGKSPGMRYIGKDGKIGVTNLEATYEFSLRFYKTKRTKKDYEISHDKLNMKNEYHETNLESKKRGKIIGKGEYTIIKKSGDIEVSSKIPPGLKQDDYIEVIRTVFSKNMPANSLLMETNLFNLLFPPFYGERFSDILIFDFNPKVAKRFSSITGKNYLEEDGSNLAIVIRNVIKNKIDREKLQNLLTDLLPFVEDIDVKKVAERSLIFSMKEIYNPKFDLPSSLLSDGTINITALILALYFSKRHYKESFAFIPALEEREGQPLTIIEEPEKNIHASLISRLLSLFEDASKQKQIIITTHNPVIVKHAGIERLLLITKDEHGFSKISKPSTNKELKSFMEAEIGLDNLFIQNLL